MAEDIARIRIAAVDATKDAFASAKANVADLDSAFGKLKATLAGLGVALSVGAFKSMVDGVIESTAKLHDLAIASAATVESLSEMRSIAKLSGTDMESGIVPALQKLAAKMLEAQTGSGEASKAFAALGLSVVDAGGKLKDNGEFMVELAGKLSGLENATQRVALAKATLGKAGAQLLPFLKDLAENYTGLGKITADQAALAKHYEETLTKLGFATAATKKEFALGLLPAMNDMAEALLGAQKQGGGLLSIMKKLREDGSIDEWAQMTAIGVGYVIDVFKNFGKAIADVLTGMTGLAAMSAKVLAGGARALVDPMGGVKQVSDAIAEYKGFAEQFKAGVLGDKGYGFNTVTAIENAFLNRKAMPAGARGTGIVDTDAMGKDRAAKDSGFDTLLDQLTKKLELEKNSTELEKLNLDLARQKYALITPAQAEELRTLAAQVDLKLQQKMIDAAAVKYAEEMIKAEEERNKQITDFNQAWSQHRQDIEFETSILGKTETQRRTETELHKLKLEYQKASIGLQGEEFENLKAIYDQQRELLPELIAQNEARREAVKQQEQLLADAKRMNEDIGRSLTDALLRGFESGKSFARNFRDTLVNMFKTLVLRPIIQPIATGIAGTITGALGMSGTANAAGGGGGIGNLLSMGNSTSNLLGGGGYGMIGEMGASALYGTLGGASMTGTTLAAASPMFGAAGTTISQAGMLAADSAVFGSAGTAATMEALGAGATGAAASGAMAAIPYVGWALAAASLLGGLGGGGKTPAVLTSKDMPGGYAGYASGLGGAVMGNDATHGYRWQGETWSGAFTTEIQGLYDEVDRLGKLLGKDTSQLRSVGATIKTGGFNNPAEILPTVLDQLGATLARSIIPNFDQLAIAGESATQTLTRLTAAQKSALEDQRSSLMASLPNFLRDLSGKLGITALTGYQDSLSVSDYVAPTERFANARSLLDKTYAAGMARDLTAVNAFPQVLQQALGIGRDVFGSGPEFASLFVEGNQKLNQLIATQQSLQQEMIADLPVTIQEASQNEIAELRIQTRAVVDGLASIEEQLRLLREAA